MIFGLTYLDIITHITFQAGRVLEIEIENNDSITLLSEDLAKLSEMEAFTCKNCNLKIIEPKFFQAPGLQLLNIE